MSTHAKPYLIRDASSLCVIKRNFRALAAAVLAAALSLAGNAVACGNLLQDGDFNGTWPGPWTVWTWNGGWSGQSTTVSDEYDGTAIFYCGGSSGQSGGCYQYVAAAPGIPYTLSCVSAVNNWWWPDAIMRMTFFDASNNQLLMVETNCAAAITGYDTGLPWSNYTFTATSPANTAQIKVEFTCDGQGTVRFDNAVLTAPVCGPDITNTYPDGSFLMQNVNVFSFTVVGTTAPINTNSIQVIVNDVNVSSNLTIAGSPYSEYVAYSGLTSNMTYTVHLQAADANGMAVARTVSFDTFNPVLSWEAEDYDYTNGQFMDNPPVDAYANKQGVPGVDYYANDGPHTYRPNDSTGQEVISDIPRIQYVAAGTNDYDLEYFHSGYWANYTRTVPAGTYNVYLRAAAGSGASYDSLGVVTNGVGTSSQSVQPLGTFAVAGTGGWGTYAYTVLRDQFGNLANVTLSGQTTFQVQHTGGQDLNMNFFILVPAGSNTNLPTITQVAPLGRFQSTNTLKFVASSPAGIATSNIVVILNGQTITDLTFAGCSTNWNVNCPLAPGTAYTAVITVTDTNGAVATTALAPLPVSFDTFSVGSYTWQAPDYDYNGGQFFDNPQVNAYFNLAGIEGVDYTNVSPGGNQAYRSDNVGTETCGDLAQPQYTNTAFVAYDVGWTAAGDWWNYTRTYPAGKYYVYLRAADGNSGAATVNLQQVTSGWGTYNQAAVNLGAFTVPATGGWQTYAWSPLTGSKGDLVTLTLNGSTNTLRLNLTSGGCNLEFMLLAPALALNASAGGGNIHLSFGTQSGFNYTVLYKNNLTDSAWTVLNTVAGDDTVKTTSDSMTGASRFYLLQAH